MSVTSLYLAQCRSHDGLRRTVREIERNIISRMAEDGYNYNQIITAVNMVGLFYFFTSDKDEVNAYYKNLLPENVSVAVKNVDAGGEPIIHYSKLVQGILPQIERPCITIDEEVLAALQEDFPQVEVREGYMGHSFYRCFSPDSKASTTYEQKVWCAYSDKRQQEKVAKEAERERESFQKNWQVRPPAPISVAYDEGILAYRFLEKTKVSEETLRLLLRESTAYDGEDKEAYVQKLAADTIRKRQRIHAFRHAGESEGR